MWDKSECVQNVPAEKVEERKPILLSADKRSQQQISNRFLTVLASSLSSESIVTCQPLRRKVFSLQAATGEYGWEYLQGAEEDGDGPSLSDQVAVVVPVKIFSESGGVWGWSSANDRPLHSYSPQELAAATSSTSPPQQQSFQTNGNVEGKGEYLKLPQAAGEFVNRVASDDFIRYILLYLNSHHDEKSVAGGANGRVANLRQRVQP